MPSARSRRFLAIIAGAVFFGAGPSAVGDPIARGLQAKRAHSRAVPTGVSDHDSSGYYVPYVTGASGEKVPVMSVPGSVTVVPRQLMDDQQATSVCDALRNVSGVSCR
jgi:outer membrane receptor for monomeric catechols